MKYLYFTENYFIEFPALEIPRGTAVPLTDSSDIQAVLQTKAACEISEKEYKAIVSGEYASIVKGDIQELTQIGYDGNSDYGTYFYAARVSPELKTQIAELVSMQTNQPISANEIDTIVLEQDYFASGSPIYCNVWVGANEKEIKLKGEPNEMWISEEKAPNFNQALAIAVDSIEEKDIKEGSHFVDYCSLSDCEASYLKMSPIALARANQEDEPRKSHRQAEYEK